VEKSSSAGVSKVREVPVPPGYKTSTKLFGPYTGILFRAYENVELIVMLPSGTEKSIMWF
jgi:hypothetical protein